MADEKEDAEVLAILEKETKEYDKVGSPGLEGIYHITMYSVLSREGIGGPPTNEYEKSSSLTSKFYQTI